MNASLACMYTRMSLFQKFAKMKAYYGPLKTPFHSLWAAASSCSMQAFGEHEKSEAHKTGGLWLIRNIYKGPRYVQRCEQGERSNYSNPCTRLWTQPEIHAHGMCKNDAMLSSWTSTQHISTGVANRYVQHRTVIPHPTHLNLAFIATKFMHSHFTHSLL